ncbi:MAG: endonuclease [Bacteroidetes bacterium MedPE-SWsnd-G2]|nr:MAG: endonuclease [Bacteroidetes bacterium MedPE-SWsnd-G2]
MKGLKFFDKLVFVLNTIAAITLLLSYVLAYLPPKQFASLSVLSLAVPFLIVLNLLFFLYWLFKMKRQLMLSLFVLLLGYSYLFSFFKISKSEIVTEEPNFKIMNYNVRLFNLYNWIEGDNVTAQINDFILQKEPDVICFQEYIRHDDIHLKAYNNTDKLFPKTSKCGLAVYSKYPIINANLIEFDNSYNNAMYADIVKGGDTLRVFNVHLQSSGINTDVDKLSESSSMVLRDRLSEIFKIQQDQAELVLKHKEQSPYPVLITGDFNNTAYSYVYRKIKGDFNDAFVQAGQGFGRTFNFKFFPVRIDFVLVEPEVNVLNFETFDQKLSDHFPIMATLNLH